MAVLKYKDSMTGEWKKLGIASVSETWVKEKTKDLIREKLQGLDPAKSTVRQVVTALQSIYASS